MTKKSGFYKNKSRHTAEFSRRAESYHEHNIIQKKVVHKLLSAITSKPRKILDLGCGSGAVWELIDWNVDNFIGIDKAEQMCTLHTQGKNIRLLQADFEDADLLKSLGRFDMVISSSALQWAKDLPKLLENIASITDEIAFAIFCNGTFRTIYEMTGIPSFLPEHHGLQRELDKHFNVTCSIEHYRLTFDDNISKFRYIKGSGVSGGMRRLNVEETRRLIRDYPHDYLEFEVLFATGKSRHGR